MDIKLDTLIHLKKNIDDHFDFEIIRCLIFINFEYK
jgi:hypothetical protein